MKFQRQFGIVVRLTCTRHMKNARWELDAHLVATCTVFVDAICFVGQPGPETFVIVH